MAACPVDSSWTDVLTAFGTVGAVGVAVFGYLLPKLMPPRLTIRIADVRGSRQRVGISSSDGVHRDALARYYHVEVTNDRRWARAHNVQVLLLRIEEKTDAGWTDIWAGGGIRLTWQHEHATGPVRNVGAQALADLFHVVRVPESGQTTLLRLTPIFKPYGENLQYLLPVSLRLTVQAQSDEADSKALRVEVCSNGRWEDGASEMAQHVVVKSE